MIIVPVYILLKYGSNIQMHLFTINHLYRWLFLVFFSGKNEYVKIHEIT